MKFEIERTQPKSLMIPDFRITITRTEFLKHFNNNPTDMYEELSYLVEMFCSPNCFHKGISETAFFNLAKNFKTTYKKFFLEIVENEAGDPDLQIGFYK